MSVDDLTPRQKQVAALVAEGKRYGEVADELGLSPRTIEDHAQKAADRLPGDELPLRKLMLYGSSIDLSSIAN